MTTTTPTAGRPEIDAALLLLAKLGVTPTDLLAGATAARPPVPTFAEFVPQVAATVTAGTLRAYGSYWTGSSSSGAPAASTSPAPSTSRRWASNCAPGG